jgi:cysteinyl-tRNA synthetase
MLNFTFEGLNQAKSSLDRINNFLYLLSTEELAEGESQEITDLVNNMMKNFVEGLSDDLNISAALTALFEMIRKANIFISKNRALKKDAERLVAAINSVDEVLNIADFPPNIRFEKREGRKEEKLKVTASIHYEKRGEELSKDVMEKIKLREKARTEKNFELSDQIRNELLKKGIVLEDTKDGVRWKIIKK